MQASFPANLNHGLNGSLHGQYVYLLGALRGAGRWPGSSIVGDATFSSCCRFFLVEYLQVKGKPPSPYWQTPLANSLGLPATLVSPATSYLPQGAYIPFKAWALYTDGMDDLCTLTQLPLISSFGVQSEETLSSVSSNVSLRRFTMVFWNLDLHTMSQVLR